MNENKISIVVPVYKVPKKFLDNNIEHLINQEYKNIEIILVDDGSPDECGKICDEYAKKDARIRVVHQKNKGLSGARNTGVNAATGEWLTFVDGDDYLDYNTFSDLKKYLNKDIDIICFCYLREYSDKKVYFKSKGLENKKTYADNECKFLQEKVLDFEARLSSACSKLIKTSILKNNNIYHNEILKQGAEGIEFCMRLFGKANKILFLEEYYYHYNFNGESITSTLTEENIKYIIYCFDKIKEEILLSSNKENLFYMFNKRLQYVIVNAVVSGYFNSKNKIQFSERINKTKEFLNLEIIKEAFNKKYFKDIDFKRKTILLLLKMRMYFLIYILAKFN